MGRKRRIIVLPKAAVSCIEFIKLPEHCVLSGDGFIICGINTKGSHILAFTGVNEVNRSAFINELSKITTLAHTVYISKILDILFESADRWVLQYWTAPQQQSNQLNTNNTSLHTRGPHKGPTCNGPDQSSRSREDVRTNMSVVMQIESPVCNSTHVAQPHYTSEASSNSSSSSHQEEHATATIPTSAAPVVYTVTPATRTPGAAPQLVKVVSNADGTSSQLIKVVSASAMASTSPGDGQTADLDPVYQRADDGQATVEGSVVSQRVYSLITSGQKPQTTTNTLQKSPYNNGQQRLQTVTTLPANARVLPVSSAHSPQKVQILSNVVVSKQNIMLNKSSLQYTQRQVITSLAQKQMNNNTSAKTTIVTTGKSSHQPTTVTKAINNLVITANQQVQQQQQPSGKPITINNTNQQKTLKTTVARTPVQQPQKTIKTLSPQSPQPGYNQKQAGIKTLSPQNNHYNKMPNQVKLIPAQPPVSPRGGIKTLAPQRSNAVNTRPTAVTPKPNYIGKHAAQAQKTQPKSAGQGGKGRATGQRMTSPTKYNAQKQQSHQAANAQSSFNQSLTAQILQSLPSSGSRSTSDTGYHSTVKNYSQLQSPPDDTSLSEDIGEEVRPDFSPNISYLYQVVMLDHNYGAPPPAVSPPITRQAIGQQPANALNGTVTGNSGGGQSTAGYYGTTSSGKRHGRLPANSTSTGPMSTSLSSSHHMPIASSVLAPSAMDTRAPPDDDAASTISSEGARPEDGDEGEETETAPEGEGDEDGVTRCICDFDHDDGYMICCDICSSWQHVDCMGLDRDHIPDKYSCVRCEPRRVDRQHARTIQQRKREEFARIGGPPGTLAPGPTAGGVAGANSGSISDSSSETSTAESTGEGHHHHAPTATRHHSVSLNNNLIGKKRATPVSLSTRRKSEPASQNRRAPLTHKRPQRRESAREAIVAGRRSAAMKKREKKQVMKRKMKSRSSVDDDSQDSWPPAATSTAYSNSMGASLLQLRQWIENYEEAVTNHYSPELRARITNMRANGTHTTPHHDSKQAPPNAQADVAVQKCKVSSQPLTGLKIVMSTQSLAPNSPVIELRGKYMLSTQHRASTGPPGSGGGGLLTRQHAQRPGPFLFFYRLPRDGTEVCVDTRTYGNDARFIRRSCRPNAELRHCVEKGTLHLYVITITSVEKNSELTIKHESHDLAAAAASTTTGASTSIPCACGNPQQCGLFTNHRKNGGNSHEPVTANNNTASSQSSNSTSNTNNSSTADSKTSVEKLPAVSPATETNSSTTHRKRRGRRASSPGRSVSPPPVQEPLPSPGASHAPAQHQAPPPALSTRRASSHHQSRATSSGREIEKEEHNVQQQQQHHAQQQQQQQQQQSSQQPAPSQRSEKSTSDSKDKKKKLTREERKMEAIMKAFERLEKAEQRKQEVQARQAQRRESDPAPSTAVTAHTISRQQQENGDLERESMRNRRKKRKGRSRTISTTSQSSTRRRTRVNSTDSYMTSGDESSLLSPPLPTNQDSALTPEPKLMVDGARSRAELSPESPVKSLNNSQVSELSSPSQVNTAAGLLLALANGGSTSNEQSLNKSPEADGNSSGSNSSVQSSPGTPLSSACLLVAAAVGPLEPGFKFPKTKKAIMNEWLNKSPEPIQPVSSMSPMMTLHQASVLDQTDLGPQLPASDFYGTASTANKSLATLVQAASLCDSPPQGTKAAMMGQGVGNAKKRWLRQAISEECDSPCSRPESPPGNAEMVAPPKKRRLARESLSSEQSFTPPTTPTMLVPPSNSLVEEDYPNNDEEFYTTEDRNVSNSSPPNSSDFQKPIIKDTVAHQPMDIVYTEHIHSTSSGVSEMNLQHAELESDNGLKDRCTDMQLEFGVISKREDVMDTINKKYPDTLTTSIMDPRLGRDRPIFRDSAQLLGTVEKTIRFYEENLTGPVPQVIQEEPKEKLQGKPEMVTPAKRKLSISEYRQRKQLTTSTGGGSSGGGGTSPERPASPETPPPGGARGPGPRGRSDSTSSATSSLSSDEEPLGTATVDAVKPVVTVEPQVAVAFNSAPTAVERQRENVERLKKVFGLALDDDVRKTTIVRAEPPVLVPRTTVSPTAQPSSTTDISKPSPVLVAPLVAPAIPVIVDTKYSLASAEPMQTDKITKRLSPDTTYTKVQSPEMSEMDVKVEKKIDDLEREHELGYARFDETVSTSFIPPFNNPVYPNSTQFTSFTSVIDTCPYEGRNPSPPPPDLPTTRLTAYSMSSGNSSLTMSPSSSSYK